MRRYEKTEFEYEMLKQKFHLVMTAEEFEGPKKRKSEANERHYKTISKEGKITKKGVAYNYIKQLNNNELRSRYIRAKYNEEL